jgi:CHAT domain-containing protein
MEAAEHILFATHGTFAPNDPGQSTLEINGASDEHLSSGEIANLDLRRTRLAVLSACETGLSDLHDLGDEHFGLPAAFLLAGAQTVIASRWYVDDLATALLIGRFHENLYIGRMETAAALRAAQQWLRQLSAIEVRRMLKSQQAALEAVSAPTRICSERIKGAILASYAGANTDKPFANPYYWAAFFCFGAP